MAKQDFTPERIAELRKLVELVVRDVSESVDVPEDDQPDAVRISIAEIARIVNLRTEALPALLDEVERLREAMRDPRRVLLHETEVVATKREIEALRAVAAQAKAMLAALDNLNDGCA